MFRDFHKADYLQGVKTAMPVVFGYVPVGIAYAVMARQAGYTQFETIFMSFSVFAGASQMLASTLYGQGTALLTIVIATFILNLRHLIMSTCIFNKMQPCSQLLRIIGAYGVTDESFAMFTTADEKHSKIGFYLGLFSVTYTSWQVGTILGTILNDMLPQVLSASLAIGMSAMFIGLLIPNVKGNFQLMALVAFTGLVNYGLMQFMAPSWALIGATLLCAAVGVYTVDLEGGK